MNWQKFFKINASELPKALSFMLLAAIFQSGLTVGMTAGDSLFLSNIGVESLPYIYIVMPVIMLIYASAFSYFISRLGIRKLLYASVFAVSAISFGLFFIISSRDTLSPDHLIYLYYGLKIFTTVIYIAFYSLYWNFADLYFDMTESKRLYAYLAAGTALGVIMGGVTISFGAEILGVEYLFLLWAIMGLSSLPVIYWINHSFRELSVIQSNDDNDEGSVWVVLKKHWSSIFKIKYVALLAGMVFMVSMLAGIAEYQYYDVFSGLYDEKELAILLGWLYAGVNAFNLIVCGFLFNRLVLRIGVTNVALIQPVIYIATFSFLLLQYSYEAALFAFFAYQGMAWSVDNNNYNLLYNALPNENRAQLRTILEGLLEPIATAIAGVFLIFYASKVPPEGISLVGFIGALVLFVIVVLMKKNYLISLVQNLKTEWLDFSRKLDAHVSSISEKSLALVFDKLKSSFKDALTAFRILRMNDHEQTLESMLKLIETYQGNEEFKEEFSQIKDEIKAFLENKNYQNAKNIIRWYNEHQDSIHPELVEIFSVYRLIHPSRIQKMYESDNVELKNIALISMIQSNDLTEVNRAMSDIQNMLNGHVDELKRAIRVLEFSGNSQFAHIVIPYIHHTDPEVRLSSLRAIRANISSNDTSFVDPIIESIKQTSGNTRIIGFQILEKINDPICITPLLKISHLFTPYERRRVEDLMANMGKLIIPLVVSIFSEVKARNNSRTLAAKVLYRVAPEQFDLIYHEIIMNEIHTVYQHSYNELKLFEWTTKVDGLPLLIRFYHDLKQTKINLILELLATAGKLPAYELMTNSLRSPNAKIRSFAIETLEQGIDRNLFNLLLPLIDIESNTQLIANSEFTDSMEKKDVESILIAASQSEHPIEKSAAIMVIWNLERKQSIALIRSVIHQPSFDMVKEATISLIQPNNKSLNQAFLLKLSLLVESPELNNFHINELEYLAENGIFEHHTKGEVLYKSGDPAENLFVLLSGQIKVVSESGSTQIMENKGDIIGNEILQSVSLYKETAISEDSKVLRIQKDVLISGAEIYPEFAINLFLRGQL